MDYPAPDNAHAGGGHVIPTHDSSGVAPAGPSSSSRSTQQYPQQLRNSGGLGMGIGGGYGERSARSGTSQQALGHRPTAQEVNQRRLLSDFSSSAPMGSQQSEISNADPAYQHTAARDGNLFPPKYDHHAPSIKDIYRAIHRSAYQTLLRDYSNEEGIDGPARQQELALLSANAQLSGITKEVEEDYTRATRRLERRGELMSSAVQKAEGSAQKVAEDALQELQDEVRGT
ncbi:hypothetical protein L198_01303 [Cryptococcus wingfieldii CBS 7118]|uniref:Uncharacterized protein n=1 Tax=Cryptococcus wingfieldii CBS 7118 TaxID=1295528 RepID=A0A1E3JYU5_9TREE|nr:hypothetical protein L198_01303 [Cryptococcus wingfieldii CBS 7118]ODO06074.1 hypothetical protein L198_01303 [Cryptococcus wingfieldii CBS 7118]